MGGGESDRRFGIQWYCTKSLEDLDFTDCLALLPHRMQDMRGKTQALDEQDARVSLKINATKTKLICIRIKRGDGVSMEGGRIHGRREHCK